MVSKKRAPYQNVLVDEAGVAENIGREIVDGVDGLAAARQLQSLHVAAFGASERQNALFRQQIETRRIDAL